MSPSSLIGDSIVLVVLDGGMVNLTASYLFSSELESPLFSVFKKVISG